MSERVFTIFKGKDAGKQFILGDRPLTLGRDAERDVALRDERASRLHARLVAAGADVLLTDAGSSNGTFVNGALVREQRLVAGDVIAIGDTQIVFGAEAPDPEALRRRSARGAHPRPAATSGHTTHVMPGVLPALALKKAPARVGDILRAVALAQGPAAKARAIHLAIENELVPDLALVDQQQLYQALVETLAFLLERLPSPGTPVRDSWIEDTLALRSAPDPIRGGFQIELICIGPRISPKLFQVREDEEALLHAQRVSLAHEGSFRLQPPGTSDILARFRLPIGPPEELKATVVTSKG